MTSNYPIPNNNNARHHQAQSKFQQLQQDQTHSTTDVTINQDQYYEQEAAEEVVGDANGLYSPRHQGNNYVICRYPNGQPRYSLGPHYYVFIFALITLSVLSYFLIASMYQHLSTFWIVCMIVCTVTAMLSYLNIGLSVPGWASRSHEASPQDRQHPKYCKPCKIIRPHDTFHCLSCDVCIEGYDHHCPWVGKCVGKGNIWSFYFFLIMIFGTLILCFVSTIASSKSITPNIRNAEVKNHKGSIASRFIVARS